MYPGIVRDVEQILGFSFCQPFSFRLRCPVNQVLLTQGGFPVVIKPFVKCSSCDIKVVILTDCWIHAASFCPVCETAVSTEECEEFGEGHRRTQNEKDCFLRW